MRRRDFIARFVGSAALWPLAARAQQPVPVIGFLDYRPPDTTYRMRAFRQGLKDGGYVEGENVAIEHRWTDNQPDQLPELAAELVRRRVTVIVSPSTPAAMAAKTVTATTPIVFTTGFDPVSTGLVASLARPGGNLMGVNFFNNELATKQLELLRELVPAAIRVAALVKSRQLRNASVELAIIIQTLKSAARARGLQIQVLNARSSREIDAAFTTFSRAQPDALFVAGDGFFTHRRVQLVRLATLHRRSPQDICVNRDFAEIGGLMSYGADVADAWRQAGVYTGRILKGAKPGDLPVVQASKFELVINNQTARMLGLEVPPALLARADEVIESAPAAS